MYEIWEVMWEVYVGDARSVRDVVRLWDVGSDIGRVQDVGSDVGECIRCGK